MNPNKNFKPSQDSYERDRDGESSGVNQVNPHDTPRTRGTDEPSHQGGDPAEVRPQHRQANRDAQPDGARDQGFDAQNPEMTRRRGDKARGNSGQA
jgi:hypothetical protein